MDRDLKNYTTFKIGGIAHKVFEINNKSDIETINSYAKSVEKPLVIIGEGSNSIFADTADMYVIGLMKMKGITRKILSDDEVYITAYGGESWDTLVAWTVEQGLSGIEALSGIPGTVGAAPIQNIGAYGSELADVFVSAEVFDREQEVFTLFSKEECVFSYRDSIFKQHSGRYIITHITINLRTTPPSIPEYKVVQEYFTYQNPTLVQIRDTIITIRNAKIPDYKTIPNCGSFFKNPIITQSQFEKLLTQYPTIPHFKTDDNQIKLYAGWLIEHVDYKSAQNDKVIFNEKNKLILINNRDATYQNLIEVVMNITRLVKEVYDVELEAEPNFFE